MLPCKTEHGKTEVQPTAQHKHKSICIRSLISFLLSFSPLVGWGMWKGISLPQHVQHGTDQMHHLCKLSENLDLGPALGKSRVNRKELATFQIQI
jgi:hypothetical protein